MAYFRLVNPSNQNLIQIDDTYKNLEVRATGTGSASTSYGSAGLMTATVVYAGGVNPMIAVSSDQGAALLSREVSGSTYTFTVVFAAAASFTYYIFDEPSNSAANYGLVIRKASDPTQVIFDATKRYLRVQAVITGTDQSITLPSGTYAVLLGVTGAYILVAGGYVGGGPSWMTDTVSRIVLTKVAGNVASSSTVTATHSTLSGASGTPDPTPGGFGALDAFNLVLNITNF
jgi:hypothetical protein